LRRVRATTVAAEKQYSECVIAELVIEDATHMRHIVFCDLYNIFPHYLINRTIYETMCWT